jgi:hypothetical protein
MPTRLHTASARARARTSGAPLAPALAAALAIALAGCGSSSNGVTSKSPAEILAASTAAAQGATSVHVVGRNAQGPLSLTFDLHLARDGGRGQVSVPGLAFEVVRVGSTVYVKGNPAFDRRVAATTGLHVPKGAWLKAPAASGRLAQLAAFTDLIGEQGRLLRSTGSLAKGAASTVNGKQAIELKLTGKLFTGSLFIATTGKPYPIQIVKRGQETGQTTFSGWNAPVSLIAPASVIALSQLGHEGH